MMRRVQVKSNEFYNEYYGHRISDLEKIYPILRKSSRTLIWTAGDSTLDNKYWFTDHAQAVGVYKEVLNPPMSKCDVTYWLNFILEQRKTEGSTHVAAINTAVEATTLNARSFKLKRQDIFLRDHISKDDILIVSVGGNDVALLPSPCTIASMIGMLTLPMKCVEHGCTAGTIPVDDCCCGCGPSFCSCAGSCPPCLGYFAHMFGVRVQKYIEKLTEKTKPKKILVCMVYYLDEAPVPSWAGASLKAMGYDRDPARLQGFIKKVFEVATRYVIIYS